LGLRDDLEICQEGKHCLGEPQQPSKFTFYTNYKKIKIIKKRKKTKCKKPQDYHETEMHKPVISPAPTHIPQLRELTSDQLILLVFSAKHARTENVIIQCTLVGLCIMIIHTIARTAQRIQPDNKTKVY